MAFQGKLASLGTSGLGLGLLSRTRGTFARVRSTIRPPQYMTEAARVVVQDSTSTALDQAFICAYVGADGTARELWGYKKSGELKAVLGIYYNATALKYEFAVSKVTAEALTVQFDKVTIGTLSAISIMDAPGAGQILHEAAAPTS